MRGKDYNTGLRGGLFEEQHYRRMGAAVWLYGWLVLRQTHQSGSMGWVLGGAPICYAEIEEETGFNRRTLERWMAILRASCYIETQTVPGGVSVRITKAKKFLAAHADRKGFLGYARMAAAPRNSAEGVRNAAEHTPQARGAATEETVSRETFAVPIGSSSIAGSKGKIQTAVHTHFSQNVETQKAKTHTSHPSGSGQQQNRPSAKPIDEQTGADDRHGTGEVDPRQLAKLLQEARQRLKWARADREQAVRREIAVGAGPEVSGS
jgi:hypothetical protein